jgi:hypothetical protein
MAAGLARAAIAMLLATLATTVPARRHVGGQGARVQHHALDHRGRRWVIPVRAGDHAGPTALQRR